MMNRAVELNFPPKRIISVVPSQTELLHDLGLDLEVIGITKFCVHPKKWHEEKIKIGGTKSLHLEKIIELKPDLIIANKEENTQSDIEYLAQYFPIWISDIKTLKDAQNMILQVGELTGKATLAKEIVSKINTEFDSLSQNKKPKKVAYLIWRNPWMTVGNDTFIHDMICRLGWQNVFENEIRYPETSLETIAQLTPELILLSSEPYPFQEKHIAEIQKQIPNEQIILVDGEMFSWYGSRMLLASKYFKSVQNDL